MAAVAIQRRKLYEDVADHLEKMIQTGVYETSDMLPSERDLMKHFGVGRPAVREALFHLRKMGVVELRSGERARVTRPTAQLVINSLSGTARHMLAAPHGVQEFQSARTFFEVGLVRHAASFAKVEDIAEFEAALAVNRKSIGDLRRFEQTDVAFHYVLAVIPGNAIFKAIHEALAEWLLEQRRTTLAVGEDVIAYEAHRAIFEAVASHDPDRAERAMRRHLDYVARRYTEITEGRG
jgi:GntR family transcriptional regulator, sialic acid-inducible nan operon repressor